MKNRPMLISTAVIASALASALAGCGHTAARARPAGTSGGNAAAPVASAAAHPVASGGAAGAHTLPKAPRSATAPTPASVPAVGGGSAPLADGLYVDAPDGQAHYVVAISHDGARAISGSIIYLYQDGRADTVARYTGTLPGSGRLSITLSDGQAMIGTYQPTRFTLGNCGRFLPHTTQPDACDFAYHGHIP